MIPELGHFALVIALTLALAQAILPLAGAATNRATLMGTARTLATGQFVFVAGAFAALVASFMANDFSVVNVATNSNSRLPGPYRFAASWGSHEGSMLLWTLMLAGWTFAVALFSRHLPERMVARVIGVMGLVSAGFLLFMLLTSNPFARLLPAAADGRDLNPLLQDPGMVIHPPMLYMGYVGFSVAFAFAIAALLEGRLDAAWARWSRPWTTAAWSFLTVGIMLGSWWAYYELGWGGWWFWDPVENASFMPWLAGTALIHSLAVTEKRGTFRSWTVLLAITAFSLSLVGTFLVRSGVLTSVHAFATDPARGIFILGFLVLVIGGSLALFAWRAPRVGLGGGFSPVSRESLLLANNVLLAVALAAVMLGTLYPLFLDALDAGKISVGPPYFEAVFAPLMAPAIFLMAVGPVASWKRAELPALWTRLKWAFAVAVAAGLILPFAFGRWSPLVAFGLLLAAWVIAASVVQVRARIALAPQSGLSARIAAQPAHWYGMVIAHLGIAIFIIGVTLVKGYETERDIRMAPGEKTVIGGYEFTFTGTKDVTGPNYLATQGQFEVRREGDIRIVRSMHPEKRVYQASGQTMTEADIDTGFTGDLYVSLGEPVGDGAWGVRVYHKPFVDWIWGGCLMMALGGILAIADKRYRSRMASHAKLDAALAPSKA
ncbi:c-type cytochrome biogenesis protein CcmF [Betaproteobacteria bacterium GR16-43]|nr:c-type cytochrome biogenesis protein CcmF [Betaproteobacteria bacterium GR16-43]